ncbi:GntR family transcriptional regulator [Rubellimicrobium rubrum]|uniref:GntR family transcriptional regulator n=1 Tax=Rubellimicrobium rubrum TaxID=2585369 RepID=A0A5C4N771_9RHOB|nr:GntR family transcriptional regulator [Rubellimicrobium rubrum]TNC52949.1 GntR family transcriptional regulator [Rubellimicrobium rubrum]
MLQDRLETPPVDASTRLRPLGDFPGSLSQKVYSSLKEAILDLTLRPGAILRKSEVCALLGVSRSPVSEAVARLATEALVDVVPQAGTFVARLSVEEVREGAFLREALELAAMELVAGQATDDQLAQLRRNLRLQEVLVADGDTQGFYAADAQFHELILSFTGHRRLPQLSRTAWVHVDRARRLLLPTPGRVQETLEEHRAILAGLDARNPERARSAARTHLRQLVTRLERLVEERPELFA